MAAVRQKFHLARCSNLPSHLSVSVIDTASNAVSATIPVNSGPLGSGGIAITPDGKHAYVTNEHNGVSVIDTASNTVVATVPIGNSPLPPWP